MSKNKKAQRTKNNARPSNSSRSAELLGSSISNFVGFSAAKDGGYVPILPGLSLSTLSDIEISSVDASFQIVLKKMNKKDATTKYKALQEFATLCEESDLSKVEGILPFWPRFYCTLATDIEHRVREAAQLAHAAVVKRVGKSIAMYLKQLAGAWFTSQFDPYPPVASAATNSFNNTFPPKKIVDAIVHCQNEILFYICDITTIQTPETFAGQKSLTPEEKEARYQKVLTSCLLAYSYYFNKIPIHEIEKVIHIHNSILSSNKFWKLSRSEALPTKTAFFNVLSSVIGHADLVLLNEKKKALTAIMNSLDENEPSILSAVWEAMLVAVTKLEDWYQHVNVEKLVLPKLWRVLRSGGQSSASIIYPNLLPFISQFPKLNIDKNQFYINFFDNMRQGFLVKSVQISRSEIFAVSTSFFECLRYIILCNNSDIEFCSKLVKEQLISVIEMCILEGTPAKETIFCEVSHLVRYWSKNRNNIEYKCYLHLINLFWNELGITFEKFMNKERELVNSFSAIEAHNSQIDLLLLLKNNPTHRRKNLKVQFSEPNQKAKAAEPVKSNFVETEMFDTELLEFVNKYCVAYFNYISTTGSKRNMKFLNKLINNFENKDLFIELSKTIKADAELFDFYNDILKAWLEETSEETEDIIQMVFSLMKYVTDFEKDKMLESLTLLNDAAVTRSVVQFCLSKDNRNNKIVKHWYSQPKVNELLIDIAREIANNQSSNFIKDQNMILLAFETSDTGDFLISIEGINQISEILCNSLTITNEVDVIHLIKLISALVPLTWAHKQPTSGALKLIETLFELCTRDYAENDVNVDDLRNIWKKGLFESHCKLSHIEFLNLTKKFSAIIWKKIFNLLTFQNQDSLKVIATDFVEYIINHNDLDIQNKHEIVNNFLTESNICKWLSEMTGVIMYAEIVSGNFFVASPSCKLQANNIDITQQKVSDTMENCLNWASFVTEVLSIVSSDISSIYPLFTHPILSIMHVIILSNAYSDHYRSTKHYENVSKLLLILKNRFQLLPILLSDEMREGILQKLQKVYEDSCILPYMIRLYYTEICANDNCAEYLNTINNNSSLLENEDASEKYLQAIQILGPYLNKGDIIPQQNDLNTLIIGRSLLQAKMDDSVIIEILEKIISNEKEYYRSLLLDCDISDKKWGEIILCLEIIRSLTSVLNIAPLKLQSNNWDFILICLASWQLSINKSQYKYNEVAVIAFTVAISKLFIAVQNTMNKYEAHKETGFPPELLDEWKNVYSDDIHMGIGKSWMFYCNLYDEKEPILSSLIILDYLGSALMLFDENLFYKNKHNITVKLKPDTLINVSLKLLKSSIPSIQLGAHWVLKHSISNLVKQDQELTETENFDSNKLNIKRFIETLSSTQFIVNAMLMDFKLCDTISCTTQPFTDSYAFTLCYLLTWATVLEMCAYAHGDLRYQYAEILKTELFSSLLNNIFRLMPVEIHQDSKTKSSKLIKIFSTPPSFNFGESWTEWRLDHIVCWIYTNCLRHLPVLVRQWWSTADSRVSAAVDKITTHYVSPMLCQEELCSCPSGGVKNMQIKVHSSAREVVAIYQMDDTKLELSIILPSNHPLGQIIVEPGQHAGGAANWRNCHMQLFIFLTHQNGSIWDGLLLWKRNLDKKFAGVEECYICFSIFHISTYQIPKLTCHTCRKKFHTHCLYKWFSTSQKSTCPICRNVF